MLALRPEAAADHARVVEIQAAAFERRNEADLVESLRRLAEPHLSLVAEERGRILGHILFTPVEIEARSESPRLAGLAPVAVDPAHQGVGMGAALIRAGLAACPALGWQAVFLVGNPGYYGRFGFRQASPLGFTYGDPLFDSALQVLEFRAGTLVGLSGRVRFHTAFAETGCG